MAAGHTYQKRVEVVTGDQFTGTNQTDMVALAPTHIKVEDGVLYFDAGPSIGRSEPMWAVVTAGEWLYVDMAGVVQLSPENFLDFWKPGGGPVGETQPAE